jgi:protein transport protein SEC31
VDASPVILVWDLRNTNQPQQIIQGHDAGILSLSWCQQDPSLLLSCGKDNRTICWNPQSGQSYGEFPIVTNWTFQTRWNPHNPSILATAAFDGKISVQTIQNTKQDKTQNAQAQALDGEDFFAKAQTEPQVASFSLSKAPKWMERPTGASFAFGGKVVKFSTISDGTTGRKSKISITSFAVDEDIGSMTEAFAQAMSAKDLKKVCETRIAQATLESEKTDWKVIETLIADNPRRELINYIGISKLDEGDSKGNDTEQSLTEQRDSSSKASDSFFDNGLDGDNFLSEIASTKGAKTNNPFEIFSESESEAEKRITKALLLGQFEKAMEICLEENRMSDAFMIAICGGQNCMDKVQKAYFRKQANGPKYLRILASVVGKNLWDVVYNADLKDWREVMATLCTYANAEEFPDLCEALGDRLEEQAKHDSDHTLKQHASFCYIAGSKLEKVVGVWIAELEYNEEQSLKNTTDGSSFSIHARSLQNFIEKVTVFRDVTRYQDKDRSAISDWKLAELYEKYIEYADIVSAHGQLKIASDYLSLLPEKYPAADVARNRVKQATSKTQQVPAARQVTNMASLNASRPFFEDSRSVGPTSTGPYAPTTVKQPTGPYAPAATISQPSGPYAPSAATSAPAPAPYAPPNPMSYNPTTNYQPTQPSQPPAGRPLVAPPPSFGAPGGGPPRASNASPAVPASNNPNLENWNDTPANWVKAPRSRGATPSVPSQGTNTPFAAQPFQTTSPPNAGQPYVLPKVTPAPPPPPPKGPAIPQRTSTPQQNFNYQQPPPERPSSSAAGLYAPPPPTFAQPPSQPQIPRGPSPYNPPPAGAQPAPGRYAPAPSAQPQQAVPPSGPPMPTARAPPPPNPFASRQSFSAPGQDFSAGGVPPPGPSGPPGGPPIGSVPPTTHTQPPRTQKPPTPKFRKHFMNL